MRRLLLHAGMDKTGTTAAQTHLGRLYDQHLERGVLYPRSGRFPNDVNHLALFVAATDFADAIPTPLPRKQARKSFSAHLDDLRREIATSGAHTVILSHEALWLPIAFPPDIIHRIVNGVLQDWPDARVEMLSVLRESGLYALSSYAQSVTGPQRSTQGFASHMKELRRRRTLSFERRLTEFAQVVGTQNVHVRAYSPKGGGTVAIVRDVAGLEPCSAKGPPLKVNARSSWTGLQLHRIANAAKMPRRMKRWTVVPIDRVLTRVMTRSRLLRRADAFFCPAGPADLARLRTDFPMPSWPVTASAANRHRDTEIGASYSSMPRYKTLAEGGA